MHQRVARGTVTTTSPSILTTATSTSTSTSTTTTTGRTTLNGGGGGIDDVSYPNGTSATTMGSLDGMTSADSTRAITTGTASSSSTTTTTTTTRRRRLRRVGTAGRMLSKFFPWMSASSSSRGRKVLRNKQQWKKESEIELKIIFVLIFFFLVLLCIGIFILVKLVAASSSSTATTRRTTSMESVSSFAKRLKGTRPFQTEKKKEHPYPHLDSHFTRLPPSNIYTIPHSMPHIGDKSDGYAALRKIYDTTIVPPDHFERSVNAVHELIQNDPIQQSYYQLETIFQPSHNNNLDSFYDIYNCPPIPPPGYPKAWNTIQLLRHWPPDQIEPPSDGMIYNGLCVFDFTNDYETAMIYRDAELPFVMRGDPSVSEAVERWNTPNFLDQLFAIPDPKSNRPVAHRCEYSDSNQFLFSMPQAGSRPRQKQRNPQKQRSSSNKNGMMGRFLEYATETLTGEAYSNSNEWHPPTQLIRMTYENWLKHANVTDPKLLEPTSPHWYFRLIGCGEMAPGGDCDAGTSEWLFDELTFFQPRPSDFAFDSLESKQEDYESQKSIQDEQQELDQINDEDIRTKSTQLYLGDPRTQRGIHCRFGMQGVIAENHFDGSQNSIVVLEGARRYILSHPKECTNMGLYPKGHPSARHSAMDWSRIGDESPPAATSDPETVTETRNYYCQEEYPDFGHAKSNEVVMQPGDVLYLPTHWFHYIVSLTINAQCNTRSGITRRYDPFIGACGFPV